MKNTTRRVVIASLTMLAGSLLPTTFSSALADGHAMLKELPEGKVRVEVLEDGLTMHTYLSNGLQGGMGSVNSHIFESNDAVMIIDTQFYKAAAMDLRAYVEQLDKPVERIIVSHAHPDHGFGGAYLDDLAPISATEAVREEAAAAFPFFADSMVQRMGEEAAKANFPLDSMTQITESLPVGTFTFGPTEFEVFELPSHEVGIESFIRIPEHKMLMVFDAVMPNSHQLVFATPTESFTKKIEIGLDMLTQLNALEGVEKLVFGHNSIEPLSASEQISNARNGLKIYTALSKTATNADEFIEGAKKAQPDWYQFYVPMTAGGLYR